MAGQVLRAFWVTSWFERGIATVVGGGSRALTVSALEHSCIDELLRMLPGKKAGQCPHVMEFRWCLDTEKTK